MDKYSEYIAKSRYARYREDLGRRESWEESVDRYIDFFLEKMPTKAMRGILDSVRGSIYDLDVVPAMRALATAGPALERDNVAGYNCSYLTIDNTKAFDETLYILACGTGVGYSVEKRYVAKLPELPESYHDTDTTIVVPDSKIGWASSLRQLLTLLWSGQVPKWDTSRVRPAGAPLKTFGGRASGPEPLEHLFEYLVCLFTGSSELSKYMDDHTREQIRVAKTFGRQGKLTSIEVHDILCNIAEIIVVGGVRRSAMLSLSDFSDTRMSEAKSSNWWDHANYRRMANNSVAYTGTPDIPAYLSEMRSLYKSYSGERGFFNREAAKAKAKATGRREYNHEFGCNPLNKLAA